MYENLNYGGASEPLNRDIGNLESLEGPCDKIILDELEPIWGDCISSLRVNPGWTATLYQDDSYRGQSFTITADTPNLTTVPGPCRSSFNDCVSSIRISKLQ